MKNAVTIASTEPRDGHSAPILAGFEALPDMLTARDLEAVMQIDRKAIYAYVQRGLIRSPT